LLNSILADFQLQRVILSGSIGRRGGTYGDFDLLVVPDLNAPPEALAYGGTAGETLGLTPLGRSAISRYPDRSDFLGTVFSGRTV